MATLPGRKSLKTRYQDSLIIELAKKYNRDPRVIKEIAFSPIKFANRVISDPNDIRPIRVRYFGVFTLKHKEGKMTLFKGRVETLKKHIPEVTFIMEMLGYIIKDENSVNRILDEALESGDHEKIETIWEEYELIKRK